MEPLSTMAIVGIAIKAIGTAVETYKLKTPNWSQKEEKRIFNKLDYLTDLYEVELKKPRYVEGANNENARSEDSLFNKRDALLRYGQTVCDRLRSTKS